MEYSERFNKVIVGIRICMIVFAVAVIIMLIINGFNVPNFLLFVINAVNYILFQYTNQNKLICAIVCIFLGILSNILALNIVAIIGVIFIIIGILYIYYGYKSKN